MESQVPERTNSSLPTTTRLGTWSLLLPVVAVALLFVGIAIPVRPVLIAATVLSIIPMGAWVVVTPIAIRRDGEG